MSYFLDILRYLCRLKMFIDDLNARVSDNEAGLTLVKDAVAGVGTRLTAMSEELAALKEQLGEGTTPEQQAAVLERIGAVSIGLQEVATTLTGFATPPS